MSAGKPFTIYRIICTTTGKALVSGSNTTGQWHARGVWTKGGAFWRTKGTVKKHLLALCHDWKMKIRVGNRGGWWFLGYQRTTDAPDWSRLDHLIVEETAVAVHTVSEVPATDFMGCAA